MHKLSFELEYSKLWVKMQTRFGFQLSRGSRALIEPHSENISFHFHGNI